MKIFKCKQTMKVKKCVAEKYKDYLKINSKKSFIDNYILHFFINMALKTTHFTYFKYCNCNHCNKTLQKT